MSTLSIEREFQAHLNSRKPRPTENPFAFALRLVTADGKPIAKSGPKLVLSAEVAREKVDWLWAPYIPRGMLTLIDGDPGVGKSWLTQAIAAAVSTGKPLHGMPGFKGEPQRVILLDTEDHAGAVIRPRLEKLGSNLSSIAILDESSGTLTINEQGVVWLDAELQRFKPALVVIDTLVSFTSGKLDTNRANQVREMLKPLATLAQKHGCAIVAVRHLRKGKGGKAIYQGQGSMDFIGVARSVLVVAKDSDDKIVMAHSKSNLGKLGPSLAYEITEAGSFRWLGPVETSADGLMQVQGEADTAGKRDEAKAFIREALKNGPVASTEVLEWGAAESFSASTLNRAKKGLVQSYQEGGKWYWELDPGGQIVSQNISPPDTDNLTI